MAMQKHRGIHRLAPRLVGTTCAAKQLEASKLAPGLRTGPDPSLAMDFNPDRGPSIAVPLQKTSLAPVVPIGALMHVIYTAFTTPPPRALKNRVAKTSLRSRFSRRFLRRFLDFPLEMRLVLLQTSPKLGAVQHNMAAATTLLETHFRDRDPKVDMLILPELAFTGYSFRSPEHISSVVEHDADSPSKGWCKDIVRKYHCLALLGLPFRTGNETRNMGVLFNHRGHVLHEYSKHHLFKTDHEWGCSPGPAFTFTSMDVLGKERKVSIGICMDINPWEYKASFADYEYANFILKNDVDVILLPMAWLLPEDVDPEDLGPSRSTLEYWIARFFPLQGDAKVRIVVVCNRTGAEDGATYAGTSCVFRIGKGKVDMLKLLGRKEGVLEIDVPL